MQALLRSQLPNDVVSAPSCCWLAGVETQGAAGPGAPIAALPRAQRKDRRRDSEAEKKENIRHEIRPSSGATSRVRQGRWQDYRPGLVRPGVITMSLGSSGPDDHGGLETTWAAAGLIRGPRPPHCPRGAPQQRRGLGLKWL
ncbi:unnamed protein product [Lota lota]